MLNTVRAAAEGMPANSIPMPADDINRAKAIVLTVWLALQSADATCDDIGAIGDTLYEALDRLTRAEKQMGVYQ